MPSGFASAAFAAADVRRAHGKSSQSVAPTGRSEQGTVAVAVAIVRSPDGRILVAQRTARQTGAGYWELPGGKIDVGETPLDAAVRELSEEVGIVARAAQPSTVYVHAFRTKTVRLHFFTVTEWSGTPQGREGQRLAWIDPLHPNVAPILPSNERILIALGLPQWYITTPGRGPTQDFLEILAGAVAQRRVLVGIREPHLSPDQRVTFARRVVDIAGPHRCRVVVAGSPLEAHRAGAIGIHSSAHELRRFDARPTVAFWLVTCHDAADVEYAAALGADAAVISPVLSETADCDRSPLGWDGFKRLAERLRIPVYAQGGMTPALLPEALRAGATGIAPDREDISSTVTVGR